MNNHDIQEVLSHKHLGIYFSDNGSWYEHIDYIVKKSFVRLNILRRFRLVLDRLTPQTELISQVNGDMRFLQWQIILPTTMPTTMVQLLL